MGRRVLLGVTAAVKCPGITVLKRYTCSGPAPLPLQVPTPLLLVRFEVVPLVAPESVAVPPLKLNDSGAVQVPVVVLTGVAGTWRSDGPPAMALGLKGASPSTPTK